MADSATYVGRFAPSPTGPLHFGSLLAAAASYLQARRAGGCWLLRVEDIDPPRAQPGATEAILAALEAYGFEWDGDVDYQSARRDRHLDVIESLQSGGLAYPCGCSRRDLEDAPVGPLGPVYPGTCRGGTTAREFALRLLTDDRDITFTDGLQGRRHHQLQSESGDFVILRRDGLVAYHLAVTVDDADQGVTEVVRGIDLLDSTPRHVYLQQVLELPTPRYLHIPVANNAEGQKLSKLTGAAALPVDDPKPTLVAALAALALPVPDDLVACSLADIWRFGREHWEPGRLAGRTAIAAGTGTLADV